uniref:Unc-45 myosin chaperone B n=1 Tax=Cyprinus carpio TaxID=7962 RepID=A0A8C2GGG3_CYPCA
MINPNDKKLHTVQTFLLRRSMGEIADPVQFKEEGNKHFQAGEIDKAIECYTKAIKSCKDKKALAVIYRNRSACFLKKVRIIYTLQAYIKLIIFLHEFNSMSCFPGKL